MNAVTPQGPPILLTRPATVRTDRPWVRHVCWWALVLLHTTACAFSAIFTIVYTQLSSKAFGSNTFLYDLILAFRYFPAIGVVLGILGAFHLMLLVRMIYASVTRRCLSFNLPTRTTRSTDSRTVSTFRLAVTSVAATPMAAHARRVLQKVQQYVALPFEKVIGRHGWIGVDGPYFDHFFQARELVQVVLQTIQLHKMARLLSTAWLLHVYVAIVCVNCWSSKLLHLLSTRGNKSHMMMREGPDRRRRRMYAMLIDSFLDNLVSFVMPLVVVAPYVAKYDHALASFALSVMGDDLWVIQAAADIQLLFVVSWSDFAMKLVFALLVLASTHAIHDLCHDQFDTLVHLPPTKTPDGIVASPSTRMARLRAIVHAVLITWGVGLVGLHTYAASRPYASGCLLPVRPWFDRQASCAVFQFDCQLRGSSGNHADTQAALTAISPDAAVYLTFLHCCALEMPSSIQSFHNIIGIKIYNVTIADWPAHAALHADYHTSLRLITMVRTTFPNQGDGLPDGLIHPHFPHTVADVNVCVSNLKHLPSDLDTKWPRGLSLLLEMSQFDSFPEVLTRMDVSAISLNGNHLTSVPVTKLLLPDRRLRILSAGGNPLVDVGHNVTKISLPPTFYWLIIDMNHELTALPLWLTDRSVITRIWLIAGGTPVCDEIQTARHSAPPTTSTPGFPWQQFVDCTPYPPPMRSLFRLFTEDDRNSLDRDRIGDPNLG